MSDIIDRLRGTVSMSVFGSSGSMWAELEDQRRKAAEELDALRAQLSEAQARAVEIERQEPVAHVRYNKAGGNAGIAWRAESTGIMVRDGEPLYAAPVSTAAQVAQAVSDDVVRDAERYRWLRAQHWNDSKLCVVTNPTATVRLGTDLPSEGRLDAAIDAAMLAAQQQQSGGAE